MPPSNPSPSKRRETPKLDKATKKKTQKTQRTTSIDLPIVPKNQRSDLSEFYAATIEPRK